MADSEADRIIREANQIEKNFRATRRTEDFLPVAAELLVNGKNGGYIDFGVHPEYSAFGEQGQPSIHSRVLGEADMMWTDISIALYSCFPPSRMMIRKITSVKDGR